ncbi:hypothetical protein N7465_006559 [Penicillium sp. CMV-2018d]|nr:hypothetical protein N7465_006559 [Penicillium sp. CMV-2018d]
MASSQPENEGNETTDSPETHHDNSEDRPDDVDAEEEISPEQDSDDDDDDEELDTRGCVPDSEDHVEPESEVEDNEGDDYEDDDGDDSNKLIIPQPTISESSGLANLSRQTTSDLEPEDVCLERFDRRLANATKFMKIKTDEADWNETMSPETWVYRGFKRAMERSSAEKITEIFKEVIPKSTRAILGRSNLTHEDIMALPIVDNYVARPGVYVICLTLSEDQQHSGVSDEDLTNPPTDEYPEVSNEDLMDFTMDERPEVPDKESTDPPTDERPEVPHGVLIDFTTDERPEVPNGVLIDFTTDEYPKVPNGLYTGSSIKSVFGRCVEHRANFTQIVSTPLLDDRRLPNRKIMMYLYCYAKKYGLVPSYRQIAIFPKQLEAINSPHMDTRWLVRMLEHVVTLLLGTYGPSQTNPRKHRYGYTEEMYLATLAQCEIPLGIFHPLNHAMPLKQKCGWTVGARVCQNCESQTTAANGWYYAPDACEVAVLYNCSACYWYRFRNGTARPPELFASLKARPTSGPCSNCDATESTQWEWHPRDKNHVICSKCRAHWTSDLEAFEIRCEDCHTLYAKRWTTLGNKWLDRTKDTTLTSDRIICANCYQKRNTSSLRRKAKNKAKGKSKRKGKTVASAKLKFKNNRGNARKAGEETWKEKKGKKVKENRPFPQTKLLLSYLLRVYGKDFSADGIIAEKVANDNLESSSFVALNTMSPPISPP